MVNHILCLDTNGDVWAFGGDGFGQLGLGDDATSANHPLKVDLNVKIKDI